MKNNIVAAGIIALGLIVAAILNGGIYQMESGHEAMYWQTFRLNRFTGTVAMCSPYLGCHTIREGQDFSVGNEEPKP